MAIEVGSIDCGLALGAERMGRGLSGGATGPMNRNTKLNPRLFQPNDVQKKMAPDHDETFSVPFPDYILNSPPLQAMVQTAQNAAECYGLTRAELDAFSAESHQKAAAATKAGIYKDEIVPLEVEQPVFDDKGEWNEAAVGEKALFEADECIRPDTTLEKLAALNPVKGVISFGEKEVIITPGNSCPTNVGISAALLMSETQARKLGLTPLARVIGIGVGGVKPQVMGLGQIPSTRKALRHAGIEAGQIDRVEFNEAFAAQVLPSCRDLGIRLEKVNVNGGSIAIGHPLGATGARLVTTVAKELRRSGGRYALATQCIGAGMGISTILERID
jgi:acetyl-CoA acetyltransferase family protein